MKSLNKYISEKLIIKNNRLDNYAYNYLPYTWEELRQIIEDKYKDEGPGTAKDPINFNDIDLNNINSLYHESKQLGIFQKTQFRYIDISRWNTSKITNMTRAFKDCNYLISTGDLSKWNVSKVEYMKAMFKSCFKLNFVGDLSNWKVSNVESMSMMFEDCYELRSVGDLSGWDISSVEYMTDMFTTSAITNRPNWYTE